MLCLGFTGADSLRAATRGPLDRSHRQRLMGAFMHGVVPHHFPAMIILCSRKATMCMVIETFPFMEVSPPLSVIVGFRDIQIKQNQGL